MTIEGLIERLRHYPKGTRVWEYDIMIQDPQDTNPDYTIHIKFDGVL